MPHPKDSATLARALALRAERLGPPVVPSATGPGSIWNASGINGYPGGMPVNTFALSGLPTSPFTNAPVNDPRDWRTVVAKETARKKANPNG